MPCEAKLTFNDAQVMEYVRKCGRAALDVGGQKFVQEIKLGMKKSPPNEARRRFKYRRRKKDIYHYPSFPGNPPRIDTGLLVGSIGYVINRTLLEAEVGASSSVTYAKELEFGVPGASEKFNEGRRRPFLKPVVEKYAGNDKLARFIIRELRAQGLING